MFVRRAPGGTPFEQVDAVSANNRLGRRLLLATNTLAYSAEGCTVNEESFTVLVYELLCHDYQKKKEKKRKT
jgi:hypothetical protein